MVVQKGLKAVKPEQKIEQKDEKGSGLRGQENLAAVKADGNTKLDAGEAEKEAEALDEEDDMIQLDVDLVQLEELEEETEAAESVK